MDQRFKFSLGQQVTTPDGIVGRVRSAGVNNAGCYYWLSYVDNNGVVKEICHDENELTEAV